MILAADAATSASPIIDCATITSIGRRLNGRHSTTLPPTPPLPRDVPPMLPRRRPRRATIYVTDVG